MVGSVCLFLHKSCLPLLGGGYFFVAKQCFSGGFLCSITFVYHLVNLGLSLLSTHLMLQCSVVVITD